MADAGLDWRPVTTPDISSGSLQGLDVFSRLIGSAGRRVTAGIQGAEDRGNEQAALAATRAVAGMTAEQIEAGLRDGSLTADNRLRAADIRGLQMQAVDALKFSEGKLNLDKLQTDTSQRKALDAAAGTLSQARALAGSGNRDEALAILSTIDPKSIGYANLDDVLKDFDADVLGSQTRRSNDQSFTITGNQEGRAATLFKQGEEDRAAQEGATSWMARAQRLGYTTGAQIADLAMDDPNLSDREKYYILSGAGGAGGMSAGGGGAVGGAGGVGAGGGSWAESIGLVSSESGGDIGIVNKQGYGGRLQFGADRLADAAKAGIIPAGMTGTQFAKLPLAEQVKVENWHFQDIDRQASSMGLDAFLGRTIAGVPINQNSIRTMAHLGGIDGVRRFIQTNGGYDPADANGTRLSDYGKRFGASNVRPDAIREDAGAAANVALSQGDQQTSFINQLTALRSQPAQTAQEASGGSVERERALTQGQAMLQAAGITGVNNQTLSRIIDINATKKGWLGNSLTTIIPGDRQIPLGDGRFIHKDRLVAAVREADQLATTAAANSATSQADGETLAALKSQEAAKLQERATFLSRNGNINVGRGPQIQAELDAIQTQITGAQASAGNTRAAMQPQARPVTSPRAAAARETANVTLSLAAAATQAAAEARRLGTPEARAAAALAAQRAREGAAAARLAAAQAAPGQAAPAARAPAPRSAPTRTAAPAPGERAQYDFQGRPLNAAARIQTEARAARRQPQPQSASRQRQAEKDAEVRRLEVRLREAQDRGASSADIGQIVTLLRAARGY